MCVVHLQLDKTDAKQKGDWTEGTGRSKNIAEDKREKRERTGDRKKTRVDRMH